MIKIVLASSSPRRKDLLKSLGVRFTVAENTFEEIVHTYKSPQRYVKENALGKARSAAHKYKNALIIGADTVVVCKDKIIGKPRNYKEAFKILRILQGRVHSVYTGLSLIDTENNSILTDYAKTQVTMRPLDSRETRLYLESIDPSDKAGAYAIQGTGSIIVEKIYGCYYNVVGFPVAKLEEMMRKLGMTLFDYIQHGSVAKKRSEKYTKFI